MFEQIRHEERDGIIIIHLRGQFIGGDETDELRKILNGLAEEKKNALVIDLEKVTYLNSTALGVLISTHANFTKRNSKVALCNISKNIENIFVITKLTLVFDIYPTVDEAIKKLS
jgi:anti-sigma B factor antagonist